MPRLVCFCGGNSYCSTEGLMIVLMYCHFLIGIYGKTSGVGVLYGLLNTWICIQCLQCGIKNWVGQQVTNAHKQWRQLTLKLRNHNNFLERMKWMSVVCDIQQGPLSSIDSNGCCCSLTGNLVMQIFRMCHWMHLRKLWENKRDAQWVRNKALNND